MQSSERGMIGGAMLGGAAKRRSGKKHRAPKTVTRSVSFVDKNGRKKTFKAKAKKKRVWHSAAALREHMQRQGMHAKMIEHAVRKWKQAH